MKSSIIFIGDTHGFIDDFLKQKEVIDRINLDFVLAENLQNISLNSKEKYKKILKAKKISKMVSFCDVEKLIKLCDKKNIKLIGIDFENFGFRKELQEKIENNQPVSEDEEKEISKLVMKREQHQIKMIKSFENKTEKPIVVIVGSWHLRKNSPLMNSFNNSKVIYPCDKNKRLLLGPPKNKEDVFYCEK